MSPAAPEDPELTRRAAAGDDGAFRSLVAVLLPRLRRWALARTGDPDDADEVVQRTLIRLHRSLPSFERRARLSSFAYRILSNAATDLERERAEREPGVEAHADRAADTRGADPLRRLHARRMAEAVLEHLAALPPRQREVLHLVDHEGMRPTEVAELLGMNPTTVRGNLYKARRAVRARILGRYPELTEGYEA